MKSRLGITVVIFSSERSPDENRNSRIYASCRPGDTTLIEATLAADPALAGLRNRLQVIATNPRFRKRAELLVETASSSGLELVVVRRSEGLYTVGFSILASGKEPQDLIRPFRSEYDGVYLEQGGSWSDSSAWACEPGYSGFDFDLNFVPDYQDLEKWMFHALDRMQDANAGINHPPEKPLLHPGFAYPRSETSPTQ